MNLTAPLLLAVAAWALAHPAAAAERMLKVREKGYVACGIYPVVRGFASVSIKEGARGMDVDLCRAVSAAIFGTPDKVKYIEARNVAQLREGAGEIDIVARRITWSLTRATGNGLIFGPITFYDGQGFMVPKGSGITSPKQLDDKPVCVQAVEMHATTVEAYFHLSGLTPRAVRISTDTEAEQALKSGKCAAFSADVSWLGAARASMAGGADAYDILPDLISKEPLAPLVRQGDDEFFEIVRWSFFAQLIAEEYGITSQNIDAAFVREELEVQQFLGKVPGNGKALGLDERWAYNIIKTVGNYGEMFDRNVGAGSPIKLDRGLNKLWTEGGLMYAPRLR